MSKIDFTKDEILRIAESFRLAYYKTTIEGRFLECEPWAREIFGISQEETDLSKYSIAKMYAVRAEREERLKKIVGDRLKPYSDSISVNINGKRKILFDVCWCDENGNITGLVREMEDSRLLRSVWEIEKMPTGFYHIEYAENDPDHERERIIQCNDRFAQILGFSRREEVIGKNIVELFHTDKEVGGQFFLDLYRADREGKFLLNYPFKTKRVSDDRIIHLSIDVHLIRNKKGVVIGREGTIRDVTADIELKQKVKEAEERLKIATADINKFMHTFLHPVVNFSGNAELIHQMSNLLQRTVQPEMPPIHYGKELGGKSLTRLIEIRDILPDVKREMYTKEKKNREEQEILTAGELKEKLTTMINVFDYSLQKESSKILLANKIRETSLWILNELDKINYHSHNKLKPYIKNDTIEFFQGILFDHLIKSAKILMIESEKMKREVEALRSYIGLRKERIIPFMRRDIGKILERNIERFMPLFKEKEIETEYKRSGDLRADISPDDIDRMMYNLLQNAQKYSYSGENRFVRIKARELQPDNVVQFSLENFGIPIKKEEIESGDIFKFGYRSELAMRNDRDGTGMGLADVKDTIEAHNGTISITSRPIKKDGEPPQYKVPYITKVTIRIPKSRKERSKGWK